MKAIITDKQGKLIMILDNYNRLKYNAYKGVILLILFFILSLESCMVQAQDNFAYRGITTGFGIRTYNLKSDIPDLNGMRVVSEGGSAGVLFGNEVIQTRVHLLGFYYSGANTPRTVNTVEAEALVNYYPLKSMGYSNSSIQPYMVTGLAQDFMRLYGTYLHPDGTSFNNSIVQEPLAGKIQVTRATVGAGVQWNIPCEVSFVQLFLETRYGLPVLYQAEQAFENTFIRTFMTFNIGLSFGLKY